MEIVGVVSKRCIHHRGTQGGRLLVIQGRTAEFCMERARAGMVTARFGHVSSGGGTVGSRHGESILGATMRLTGETRKRRAVPNTTTGSFSGGAGGGKMKRRRQSCAIRSMAIPIKPEEAERLGEDAESYPSQSYRSRRGGELLLLPTPPIEAQPEGGVAVTTEVKVSNRLARWCA